MFSDEIEKVNLITKKIESINSHSLDFFGEEMEIVCSDPLKCTYFTCAEGGFIHAVSWLYIKYFDNKRSKENLKFLIEKNNIYSSPDEFNLNRHKQLINKMRTFLHHDIKDRNSNNINTENAVLSWFQRYCSNSFPQSEEEWECSLSKILDEAVVFFTIISERTFKISEDNYKSTILIEWEKSIIPFSVFEVSEIVKVLANKKGLQDLDCFTYSKNHYNKWMTHLKNFNGSHEERLKQIISKSFQEIP